jgi:large subunit ribosomal protein L35
MPKRKNKFKTRKSVSKRFKITKTGKVMRRGAQNRHLKANRSKRNIRRSKVPKVMTGRMAIKIKKMLGQ